MLCGVQICTRCFLPLAQIFPGIISVLGWYKYNFTHLQILLTLFCCSWREEWHIMSRLFFCPSSNQISVWRREALWCLNLPGWRKFPLVRLFSLLNNFFHSQLPRASRAVALNHRYAGNVCTCKVQCNNLRNSRTDGNKWTLRAIAWNVSWITYTMFG